MKNELKTLIETIRNKKGQDPKKSYSALLLSSGLDNCISKLEEEFYELKEALKENKNKNKIDEAADLIYHLLVTLEVANIKFEDVLIELQKREKQSGIEEKKNRK